MCICKDFLTQKILTSKRAKISRSTKTVLSSSDSQVLLIFTKRKIHDFQKVLDTPQTTILLHRNNIPILLPINNAKSWTLTITPKGKIT
jgi:hypothetical protein